MLLLCPIFFGQAETSNVPSIENVQYATNQTVVSGVVIKNNDVLIFLNDGFVGTAQLKARDEQTNSFTFTLNKAVEPTQRFFTARARDQKTYILSDFSAKYQPTDTTVDNAVAPSAPIIVSPDPEAIIGKARPAISGLTVSGSNIEIFIDGRYDGETGVVSDVSGTADFKYTPSNDLAVGRHIVYAVAKNADGVRSSVSNDLIFTIREKLPAPTLNEISYADDKQEQPIVTGLTKNDTSVNIFVDDKLTGQAIVKNGDAGTASFTLNLSKTLLDEGHLIYAVATDKQGKESYRSNYITLVNGKVEQVEQPVVVSEPEENKKIEVSDNDFIDMNLGDNNANPDAELAKILEGDKPAVNGSSSLINESQEQQGKLKWNIIIFLFFLLAVIVWIIWMNREIKNEKKELSEEKVAAEGDAQDKLL